MATGGLSIQRESAGDPTSNYQETKQQADYVIQSPDGGRKVAELSKLKPERSTDITHPWTLLLAQDAEQFEAEQVFFNQDVTARLRRFIFIIFNVTILLIIAYKLTDDGQGGASNEGWVYRIIGIGVVLSFTLYFGNLAMELYPGLRETEDAYLFKMVTRMSTVPNWASRRVANTQLLYLYRPIQSISEFNAISGGQSNQMLSNLGSAWFLMYAVTLAQDMQCGDYQSRVGFCDIVVMFGLAGIMMIGIFELNDYDSAMKLFHLIGVGMAILILCAGLIQGMALGTTKGGGYLVVPIVTNLVAWSCFVYWQRISSQENAERFEKMLKAHLEQNEGVDEEFMKTIRWNVNRMSIRCVAFQGVAIYFVILAFGWYLYAWSIPCYEECDDAWSCRVYCLYKDE